jgi:anthranilate synthase component 2
MENRKKVVIIDNYDSFTFNLVHIIEEILGYSIDLYKNDSFEPEDLKDYEYVILSPGPGIPDEAGHLKKVIEIYGPSKKILGVCLGLQALGEVYGSRLRNLKTVFHGIKSTIFVTDHACPVFKDIPEKFEAGRYHSWVIDNENLHEDIHVTSIDETGEIMSVRHRIYQNFGLQFHPESIMTPLGRKMIENFLNL